MDNGQRVRRVPPVHRPRVEEMEREEGDRYFGVMPREEL